MVQDSQQSGLLYPFLTHVERANALPHPAIMFLFLALFVVRLSGIVSALGVEALHPVTGESMRTGCTFKGSA